MACAVCFGLAAPSGDSASAATFLRGGVKAGDRSGLNLVRPPAPGKPRFAKPPQQGAKRQGRAKATQDWFWQITEAGVHAASPTRWDSALETLRRNRSERGPLYGEGTLSRVAGLWGGQIRAAARRHELSEALLLAVMVVESAGQQRARSPKGAMGLMQLIPATARRFGVQDAYDAGQNILGGAAYLDFLLKTFDEDIILALAGYNAGEGAVAKHRGVPPYAETRDYVVRVLDALVAAEPLCAARPEGPRRACVFAGPQAAGPPA